jgi:peptide deformylase
MKKLELVNGEMIEFEIYPLIDSYDPRLREPTIPVDMNTVSKDQLAYKVLSLIKSLDYYEGLGLSANQCGLTERICVINHLDDKRYYTLINPTIVEKAEKISKYKEGCLSFPGLFLEVGRPEWVVVEYLNIEGETVKQKFEGIWATCVQHEFDHLFGICYTDKVSPIKLDMAKRKVQSNLRKIRRATTGA